MSREKSPSHYDLDPVQSTPADEILKEDDVPPAAPEDTLDSYIAALPSYPLLSKDEEYDLAMKAREGDKEARERLILSNIRLVIAWARKNSYLTKEQIPLVDLVSYGVEGLILGVDKYDPDRARLTTYAVWWIRRCIIRGQSEWRPIRLPHYVFGIFSRTAATRSRLRRELGIEPTDEQVVEALNSVPSVKHPISLEDFQSMDLAAYNTAVANPQGEGLSDFFDSVPGNLPTAEERLDASEIEIAVWKGLRQLDERDFIIVLLRYGIGVDRKYTLKEVGDLLDLSRERVRQLCSDALEELQELVKVSG